ncbi:hypothetical protein ACN28S_29975 [Cystobacter fuscus]
MAKTVIRGNKELIRNIRRLSAEVLKDFGPVVHAHTQMALDISKTMVPQKSGGLRQSAFTAGPDINSDKKSISGTCGYAHEQAGPIHEGFHWGSQIITLPLTS